MPISVALLVQYSIRTIPTASLSRSASDCTIPRLEGCRPQLSLGKAPAATMLAIHRRGKRPDLTTQLILRLVGGVGVCSRAAKRSCETNRTAQSTAPNIGKRGRRDAGASPLGGGGGQYAAHIAPRSPPTTSRRKLREGPGICARGTLPLSRAPWVKKETTEVAPQSGEGVREQTSKTRTDDIGEHWHKRQGA